MDIFLPVLAFSWVIYIWETYLAKRQHKMYKIVTTPPNELTAVIDVRKFEESRVYEIDKSNFGFWNDLLKQVLLTLVLWYGGMPFAWDLSGTVLSQFGLGEGHELLQYIVFGLIIDIFNLPCELYSKDGFNNLEFEISTVVIFVGCKAISMTMMVIVIYIVEVGGENFFIYAWLIVSVITMVLNIPEFSALLLEHENTPLPEGELKTKIEELAASLEFPLKKLYFRKQQGIAEIFGFRKNKTIVLFDTLLEDHTPASQNEDKTDAQEDATQDAQNDSQENEFRTQCNTEEVVAVLGNELGHWYFSHIVKKSVIMQIIIFTKCFIFGKLMNQRELFVGFGFPQSQLISIRFYLVFSFIMLPFHKVLSFLMNALSRRFQFQADEFAVNIGKKEYLKTALLKLPIDNLKFPVVDWLYSTFHYSDPLLLERFRAMDGVKAKSG